jgi:TorA maturation chaperone TorD
MTQDAGADHAAVLGAEIRQTCAALADDLMMLARFADREVDADLLALLRAMPVASWFHLTLNGAEADQARALIEDAFAEMLDPVDGRALDDLAAEFAAIYLTHHYRAAPSESVWRDDEGLERQGAMFAVRKWYARYNLQVPDWRRRSDDHLVHELEFLAFLLRNASTEADLREAARFLREHPLVWLRPFTRTIVLRCRLSFYAGIALLTAIHLDSLAQALGETLGCDMSVSLPERAGCDPAGAGLPHCGEPSVQAFFPSAGPGW